MSVIQKIRDKYAGPAIAAIAVAMVGFILIDALSQKTGGGLFSKNTTTVGKVDGETIELNQFDRRLKQAEQNYQQQGMQVNDELRAQINNQLWKTLVDQKILQDQVQKLGLTFTDKELNALIQSPNAPEIFRRRFTDPKTGQYNVEAVNQYIQTIKRRPATDQERLGLEDYLYNEVSQEALRNKYLIMLAGAAYYPKWLSEKDNQDNSALASVSYVDVPYALVSDSTVPVSDAEVSDYIQTHKAEFKTAEAGRSISYVVFDGDPSAKDSGTVLSQLIDLKAGFATTKDAQGYINQNGSSIQFYDGYVAKSALQVPNKDSIESLPEGGLFGPYLDGHSYVIAKMLDKKDQPDSVHAKHILIATTDPQSGQAILDDTTAKRRIDSIQNLINHGANFDSLAVKLSDDAGSKEKGGDLGYFTQGQMVPEFNNFCFSGKKGDRGVVKSSFGYHLIEIVDQKAFEPHYKVAYLGKEILPSEETTNSTNAAATNFAADAQSAPSFEDAARKHNAVVRSVTVKETDYQVQGLGEARRLVKWAFDNKKGNVSDPENIGNDVVVALITGIQDAGLPTGTFARTLVENSVRRDKKAKQIADKLGAVTDLSAAAGKYSVTVAHADSVNFGASFVPNLGNEPKVIGAAFNKANLNKVSTAIKGTAGVYLVQTLSVTSEPNQNNDYTLRRQNMEGVMRNAIGYNALEGLHDAADIQDNRIKFY
ncbi:MAG TPA: peptidylprolyl isomerase [Dinghuibacter sp.]|uniref:peptidylprolyl isomerase n=1 Tax=Dinghuibacter sp. TaxID=2024697 RepID=UPI002CFE9347|nr:peptidylprolyl isomerase [Dinghuibacter sp.]HTJ11699.1 peptidylprolyl isomerase [Dinghuibacter sp.]